MEIAGKNLRVKHVPGPLGVRGRNSDNRLIREKLGWAPSQSLKSGLEKTYRWIVGQVEAQRHDAAATGSCSQPSRSSNTITSKAGSLCTPVANV
jgi:hypothetical protein